MERRTLAFIEPVAWIDQKKVNLRAVGKVRRLVHDEATWPPASVKSRYETCLSPERPPRS